MSSEILADPCIGLVRLGLRDKLLHRRVQVHRTLELGTAAFRSTSTSAVEAEGRDYSAARAALSAMARAEQLVLSVRVLD